MKKLCAFFRRVYASPPGRFLAALALAAALFFAASCVTDIAYYNNDDTNIAAALSGELSGTPYPAHPFINCLLGNAVSFCYRILPAVPWWLVFQLVFALTGLAVTGACILAVSQRKGLPLILAVVFYGVYALAFVLYTLLLVTFTLTSAVLGAAAVSLLLSMDDAASGRQKTGRYALSALLMGAAFLFRNSSGLSLLPFYFGAICCRAALLLKNKAGKQRLIKLMAFALASLMLFFGLIAVHNWGLTYYNAPEFAAFDEARGRYLDYPVDSYSDNPSLYESVGWDAELYSMVMQWFYMDGRVTAENLNAILDGSQKGGLLSPAEALADLNAFLSGQPFARYSIAVCFIALLLFAALAAFHREGRLPLLLALVMLLGGGALVMYLLLSGRLVLRVFQLVAIPAGASVLLLGLTALPEGAYGKRFPAVRSGISVCLLLALLFSSYKCARIAVSYDSAGMLQKSRALIAYALANPDKIYIRDTRAANNVDAVATYPDKKPTNLLDWGGTSAYTGAKELQLDKYGLRPFTADVFFRENVYFITEPGSRDYKSFCSYLNTEYQGASLKLTDVVADGVAVYSVTQNPMEEPK